MVQKIKTIIEELRAECHNYLFRNPTDNELDDYLIWGMIGYQKKKICESCKSDNLELDISNSDKDIIFTSHFYCNDCDHDFYLDKKYFTDCFNHGNYNREIEKPKKIVPTAFNFIGEINSKLIAYQNSKEFRIDQFKEYLERTSHEIFTLLFSDGSNAQQDYKHRWTKQYQKGIISKLYQFEAWAKRHKLDIGMITLTSAQTGYTDLEVLNRLKEAWAKLQDNLNKKKYQSFKLFEPHTKANPGYPHIHVLVIGKLWQRDIDSLTKLWKDKYNMGDGITDREGQDHSIKFDLSGGIESLKNYLMKYLDKTIVADILHDDLLLKFHSMFYDTGTHLYSASRYLYFVMKKLKFKSNVILTHLIIKNNEIYNKHESKAYPCKYQQIEGLRYKYKLAPFEIKSRWNYYYFIDILNNFNVQKIFKVWDNQLWDNKNLALLNL